jgi:hypothetical protein
MSASEVKPYCALSYFGAAIRASVPLSPLPRYSPASGLPAGPGAAMTKIVISYRRHDSDAITGRIFDRLVAHYGAESVFRDIDNIPPGLDFRKSIGRALESTDIVLAVVGPQWAGKSADGRIRINEATDLVRIEIELALRRDIPLVPILVGNATMPEPGELPEGLRDFSFRNAVKVDALEDFEDHVKRLIRSLDRLLEARPTSEPLVDRAGIERARTSAETASTEAADVKRPDRAQLPADTRGTSAPGPPGERAAPSSPARRDVDEQPGAAALPAEARQPVVAKRRLVGPTIALPIIAGATYLVLYATGLWKATAIGAFQPLAYLSLAALFALSFWRYGGVSAKRAVVAAALLGASASAVGLLYNLAFQSLSSTEVRMALFTVDMLVVSALIMGAGAVLCPVFRRPTNWIIGLLLWTALAHLAGWTASELVSRGAVSWTGTYFVGSTLRQMVVFGCIGFWLSQASRAATKPG